MSITRSQTERIGSIFNGNRFEIPTYQRKYSWTDLERKALWQDIDESIKDNMSHFIGTLSFKENKNYGLSNENLYEIIDGQQRITSIFILLKILIDRVADETIKRDLLHSFIGAEGKLRLLPLGEDGVFLNRLLFGFEEIDRNHVEKRSHQLMLAARLQFCTLVDAISLEDVERRIVHIRERLEVLVFNVTSQAQAVKMFSIINDRGLPLRILDKTKSILMLYSTIHLNETQNTFINNNFEQIFDCYDELLVVKERLGILGRLEENGIFTQHYYSSKRLFPGTWSNRDGAETIFNNLKRRCEELKDTPNELKDFIEDYVTDFTTFSKCYAKLIKEVEVKDIYRNPFTFLEFTATLYPLIVRLYQQGKLNDCLALLETIELRVYKLRGTNPIADMYWLSSYVEDAKPDLVEIKRYLNDIGNKFVNDHVLGNYLDGALYGNGGVKYILTEYSGDNFNRDSYRDLQVEHIFAKEPNFDPTAYGFTEDYEFERDRIGNLGLLEQSLNKGLGNSPPINKVDGYLKSQVTETRRLSGIIQRSLFNKSSVDERRNHIIKFCISRFKLMES